MVTREDFIELLREGLSHLYDSDYLRQSELAALFNLTSQADIAGAVRGVLTKGVDSLKPSGNVPSQSRDWRLYDALFHAYVQQLDQRIVADQLALSVRHLRREQRAAVEILADRLWPQVDVTARTCRDDGIATALSGATTPDQSLSHELAWLQDLPADRPTDLEATMAEAVALVALLADQADVTIDIGELYGLPPLAVHPVALNQILLNLFSVALSRMAGGKISVSACRKRWDVEVCVGVALGAQPAMPVSADDGASLRMAHELVTLSGGAVRLVETEAHWKILVTLPVLNQITILVIDDNADALQLMDRYTVGTRYRVVGVQDPDEVMAVVRRCPPQVIILDVMMPQVDGWKVLATLRQHPTTADVPVIVCTILTQQRLALSLGAAGFLKKPVTRQALLEILNHQIKLLPHP